MVNEFRKCCRCSSLLGHRRVPKKKMAYRWCRNLWKSRITEGKETIRFFHQSHNTVLFGGLFTLKQWIISSLKHDTVPRVNKLYCFYVKNPQNVLHYGIVKTVHGRTNLVRGALERGCYQTPARIGAILGTGSSFSQHGPP